MGTTGLTGKTILIVDDFAINTELLSLFVAEAGAKPVTASNGRECVSTVEQQHVDLVFMDLNMPVMDGIEATKTIRALPQGKGIIIVGTSGFAGYEEENACMRAGMNALYQKHTINNVTMDEIGNRFFGSHGNHMPEDNTENERYSQLESLKVSLPGADCFMVMDYDKALHEFEDDAVLLNGLMKDFNRIIHSQLAAMKSTLEQNDYDFIQRESHGIKGGAANLCAVPLSNAAKSLEMACRNQSSRETISSLLDDLSKAVISFDAFVCKRS